MNNPRLQIGWRVAALGMTVAALAYAEVVIMAGIIAREPGWWIWGAVLAAGTLALLTVLMVFQYDDPREAERTKEVCSQMQWLGDECFCGQHQRKN